jgi:hypothetical protein
MATAPGTRPLVPEPFSAQERILTDKTEKVFHDDLPLVSRVRREAADGGLEIQEWLYPTCSRVHELLMDGLCKIQVDGGMN